jgi:hypothetical protein
MLLPTLTLSSIDYVTETDLMKCSNELGSKGPCGAFTVI